MDNEITIRPYVTSDGMEMLSNLPSVKGCPDTEKWCREAEQEGRAFTAIYKDKILACAGIIKQREGVGLAWALYPPDIGNYRIDPRMAKDKLKELMEKHGFWRVEATVRCDFPAGESYLRYMGFKWEGRMKQNEPDKTDSFLYAIVR